MMVYTGFRRWVGGKPQKLEINATHVAVEG